MTHLPAYSCRRLGTRELRDTYSLALMHNPGLSLAEWRKSVRTVLDKEAGARLVAVYNRANCAIAVVRHSAAGMAFVLRPPALLADPARILDAVRDFFESSSRTPTSLSAPA
ncbi:hypothetical protein [Rhabdaerophilum sp. SD176]|uniref:hypothetical protein n=1 Tax=Rhabdaerophilum sp. SD176 TaxID=2983548 RepID=UPI0024DF3B0E|nr:hypothetical protein [Rhabdaerophilum sp. SD176]